MYPPGPWCGYLLQAFTLFSKRVALLKKVQLFVLDFKIKWDGVACLMPAHTEVFAFLRLLSSSLFFATSSLESYVNFLINLSSFSRDNFFS